MTTDPRIDRAPKPSPLQPKPPLSNEQPKRPDVKPMYEKEWDDGETLAGEVLDKDKQKKKEGL